MDIVISAMICYYGLAGKYLFELLMGLERLVVELGNSMYVFPRHCYECIHTSNLALHCNDHDNEICFVKLYQDLLSLFPLFPIAWTD